MKRLAPALLLLVGCHAGPDYRPPTLAPAATDGFRTTAGGTDPAVAPPADWWHLYDDPQLDALVGQALRANTDLRVALANLAYARGVRREARNGLVPATGVGGGIQYGRNSVAVGVAAGAGVEAGNLWTTLASADISYEVDLFGRVSRNIEAATADVAAAAAALDVARVAIVADTTQAYVEACAAGSQLAVASRSARIADDVERLTQVQRQAGASSDIEVERSRVLALQAQEQVPFFEGQRRAAALELAALTGQTAAAVPAAVLACQVTPALKAPLPIGDGAALLRRRPDVRRDERRLAAATARIGVATAALYPRITLGASIGYAANNILRGADAVTLGLGPLINWSFPNFGVARARIAQARALEQGALASFDGTVLRALKEVEQALTAYGADLDRQRVLAGALDSAERGFALSQQRRRSGAVSDLDLFVAEQSLLAARGAKAAIDARVVADQVQLFRTLGGGWQNAPLPGAADNAPPAVGTSSPVLQEQP